jgi:hypothetical protein
LGLLKRRGGAQANCGDQGLPVFPAGAKYASGPSEIRGPEC